MTPTNAAMWIALLAGSVVPCFRLARAWPAGADPRPAMVTGALAGAACLWIATIPTTLTW